MTNHHRNPRDTQRPFDARDRLILALYAQLKAERETREALEDAIRHGALSREVLVALAADPVPVVTDKDIAEIETLLDRDSDGSDRLGHRSAGRPS